MQKLNKSYIILATFFLLHLLCWVLGADLSHTQLRYDMAENYAWGQEMQLGYYKHPPLFAWVSYIWLSIFGTTHFAYFLLSQVNIIVAMVFIFLLSRKFVGENKAVFAVLLLELIIFYNLKAIRFNANTILIPLFPAISFFFVKSLQENRTNDWLLFGFTAALGMLSKYATVCLIFTFILYALHKRRDIFANPRVYFAILVFLATVSPHIYWLFQTDFLTLQYASDKVQTKHFFGYYGLLFPFSQIGYLLPAILVIPFVTKKSQNSVQNSTLLLYITFLPTMLMSILGFGMNMRIIESWGIPNWFLLTTFLLRNREISKPRTAIFLASLVNISYLIYGMCVHAFDIKAKHTQYDARKVNEQIETQWNEITQNRQIFYVVGNINPIQDFIFYSPQHPHALFEFDRKISPWIPENHERKSSLVMCENNDFACQQKATEYFAQIEFIRLEKNATLIYIPK
jgi:4-amino-4-deoxy-L-arabinose transferase-like glycosyltransferase